MKQFIEEMNGDIAVHSQLNMGTVFQVVLSLKIPLSNQFGGIKNATKENTIG